MSGVSSTSERIKAAWASIRPERRSLPKALGFASPYARSSARHRMALIALTPNRSDAWRHDVPSSTANKTRSRDRATAISTSPRAQTCGRCSPCSPPRKVQERVFKPGGGLVRQRGGPRTGPDVRAPAALLAQFDIVDVSGHTLLEQRRELVLGAVVYQAPYSACLDSAPWSRVGWSFWAVSGAVMSPACLVRDGSPRWP
jgi:hypothetical protein